VSRKQFTNRQITQAFPYIEGGLAKLSILTEIINPYFCKYSVVNAHSLTWVLTELILHVYGQTTRCWFDVANKYKTISVCEIYRQIKNSKKYHKFSTEQKKSFDELEKPIEKIRKKYEKRLKNLADKYYAHIESRTVKQRHKEYENLKISWDDITFLIAQAKTIVNKLLKFWDGRDADFEETNSQYIGEGFWNVIDKKILKPKSLP
jgi:hypothetical protein